MIGVGAGAKAELNLAALMGKRGRVMALDAARPAAGGEGATTARALERHVLPLFERGALERARRRDLPARRRAAAYERFAAGGKLGKIVLIAEPVARRVRLAQIDGGSPRTTRRAAERRARTSRLACSPRRAHSSMFGDCTAPRSTASAAAAAPALGECTTRRRGAAGSSSSLSDRRSASSPMTTTIFGCTIASSSISRAMHAGSASERVADRALHAQRPVDGERVDVQALERLHQRGAGAAVEGDALLDLGGPAART